MFASFVCRFLLHGMHKGCPFFLQSAAPCEASLFAASLADYSHFLINALLRKLPALRSLGRVDRAGSSRICNRIVYGKNLMAGIKINWYGDHMSAGTTNFPRRWWISLECGRLLMVRVVKTVFGCCVGWMFFLFEMWILDLKYCSINVFF